MGNCIESLAPKKQTKKEDQVFINPEQTSFRSVKLVVSKRELEILCIELRKGEKRFEDILVQIEEEREKVDKAKMGWKPKLEIIEESIHEGLSWRISRLLRFSHFGYMPILWFCVAQKWI